MTRAAPGIAALLAALLGTAALAQIESAPLPPPEAPADRPRFLSPPGQDGTDPDEPRTGFQAAPVPEADPVAEAEAEGRVPAETDNPEADAALEVPDGGFVEEPAGSAVETPGSATLPQAGPGDGGDDTAARSPGDGSPGDGSPGGADGGAGGASRRGFLAAPRSAEEPRIARPVPEVATVAQPLAQLRQLDKMTGVSAPVTVAVGEEAQFGRLRIAVEACQSAADGTGRATRAFLVIRDTRSEDPEPAFKGWMFAETPALSALDHPRYDVWVTSCTTRSGETASGSE